MNSLYEHSTLASLMAGNFDGTITLKELLSHGSYGLGTFTGLDGEVVILDNEVYQATSSGKVNHITDMDTMLPFASVHFPKNEKELDLTDVDFSTVNKDIVNEFQLSNVFGFLKLSGVFKKMHTRIAPKQEKPYPSLLKVSQNQSEFEYSNIKGTLIGYYAPQIFDSVTAAGWHLHFISEDRLIAGHILEFKADELKGGLEVFDTLEQHFPVNNEEFRATEVEIDNLREGIAQSEGSQNK